MNATRLFSIYGSALIALFVGLAGVSLYSLERGRWWDERIQLAHEAHSHHLRLETNLFRLLKQHGDALLIGDRDRGAGEMELSERIDQNLADIRRVIAREIEMVGQEEVEELEKLEAIEADIRQVNAAITSITSTGVPIQTEAQISRLAELLDRKIDVHLTELIESALAEELDEVEETLSAAAAFRAWSNQVIRVLLAVAALCLVLGLVSFNRQIRIPLIELKAVLSRLRPGEYHVPVALTGTREFRELGQVLGDMSRILSEREATVKRQRECLEETVQARTDELQRLIKRLEAGEESRKRLMADISHELRTPLTIILGEAEVALRISPDLSHDLSDTLACIREAAKHTNQIVDDMLTVARQEAGQLRLDLRRIDLRAVLRDAAEMFPQTVELDLPGKPASLAIDAVRIRQSFLALFQNARRYGGPGITARLRATETGFRITVEDDGPGLDASEKLHAFDRFFRGSNASGQGIEGSGLGLPVVKSIVEAHGGTVVLEDARTGGLAVHIHLPRVPAIEAVQHETDRKRA
jgi:signal transduction histidine kinase